MPDDPPDKAHLVVWLCPNYQTGPHPDGAAEHTIMRSYDYTNKG